MKKRFLKVFRLLFVLWLCLWAVAPQLTAQTPLGLSIEMNAGRAQLTLTGAVGTACQIQWTTNLFVTNGWFHLSHSVLTGSPSPFTDATSSSEISRYYRAVWTPSTNLVWISPGTFTMGSPDNEALRGGNETQHIVTLSRGFWMGKYEVTQKDYLSVVGSNPSFFTPANGYSPDLTGPVEQVSWNNASNYCALRTQQERAAGLIRTNWVYRLPTESEWEYADRAGTTTAFYLGSSLHSGQANFNGQYEYDAELGEIYNTNGIFLGTTTPVGSYAANPWGLYDMIGNAFEWCQDWYGTYPTGPVSDPQGAVTGSVHVRRGGSWYDFAEHCRSGQRYANGGPNFTSSYFGIRVVLDPSR
jgi:sulfatase modifying factor 1